MNRTINLISKLSHDLLTNVNSKFYSISYVVTNDKQILIKELNSKTVNTEINLNKYSINELRSKIWQLA